MTVPQHKSAVAYLPAVVGAVVSVGIIRSGFLMFLFLVPFGVLAYCYTPRTAWVSAAAAVAGNVVFALVLVRFFERRSFDLVGWNVLYFAVMIVVFTWITAPPFTGFFPIPLAYRFAAGAVAGSLSFIPLVIAAKNDAGFYQFIKDQVEAAVSLYASSSGADVVTRSLSERYMTPGWILDTLEFAALRGGAVVSCLVLLFLSRQIALIITWFVRRVRIGGSILRFRVTSRLIWVFSCSLLAALLGSVLKITVLEIAAWNILVLCGIMYLAQGGGILFYFLEETAMPPLFRFGLHVLVFIVIFSPGINAFALGALVLLGIAENWVPFRAPKSSGPSSTPGTRE
jgi:hypothetical protein